MNNLVAAGDDDLAKLIAASRTKLNWFRFIMLEFKDTPRVQVLTKVSYPQLLGSTGTFAKQ